MAKRKRRKKDDKPDIKEKRRQLVADRKKGK